MARNTSSTCTDASQTVTANFLEAFVPIKGLRACSHEMQRREFVFEIFEKIKPPNKFQPIDFI